MSRAANLYKLQQLDSELDQCLHRLSEIVKLLADDRVVQAAQAQLSSAQAVSHDARLAKQRADDEFSLTTAKRKNAEERLYNGSVKNPKELQELQDLSASLKKLITSLEERQLEMLVLLEAAEKAEQEKMRVLQSARNEKATLASQLAAEQGNLREKGLALKKKRAIIEATLSLEDRQRYAELRKTKRGLAVAAVSDAACAGCGVGMSNARVNQARASAELVFCSNCGRILYVN